MRYEDAEKLFRIALERLTDKYTTPKDAEPFYYLGMALKSQGKYDEAFDAFYQATWNMAWRAPAYYSLTEIAAGRGDFIQALDLIDGSLQANALNIRAINLKVAVLRHLGRSKDAEYLLTTDAFKVDPLDVRSMAERWLISKNPKVGKTLVSTMLEYQATAQETAAEYLNAGLWQDGLAVLKYIIDSAPDKLRISPMFYYYLAYFAYKLDQMDKASEYCRLAQFQSLIPERVGDVFTFQDEAIVVLKNAMTINEKDACTPYLLGNLLYDWQPERAVELWEKSALLNPSFPIVHRSLAIAYSHQKTDDALVKAIASLEKTVTLPTKYSLHFAELDEFYEAAGTPVEKRLVLLEANQEIVQQRDDALSRLIGLKVFAGKYDEAMRLMIGRRFEVWEGGQISVAQFWTDAHLLRGRKYLADKRSQEALADFQAAGQIPDNLPSEQRGVGGREAEIAYWTGCAYEALGNNEMAQKFWTEATTGSARLRFGGRRVGGGSAQQYYQALSLRKLGQNDKATAIFQQLLESAMVSLQKGETGDFFTSFGQSTIGNSQRVRISQAHYLAGLAHLGLDEKDKAKEELAKALQDKPDHIGAKTALSWLE